jgi:tryptophanyl-tRNA synthetase
MTQFKEKAGSNKENASVGLYVYPVLMAADILLYDASHVPVGNDQKQHLELARDVAQKFNNDFSCEGFIKVPEPIIQKEFSRIMSLKDGQKKMSKSDLSEQSRINLNDDKDTIINKIKKAKTDSAPLPGTKEDLDQRPEAKNLINIYCSLSEQKLEKVISEFEGKNFSYLKDNLSDLIIEKICPIGNEIKKLLKDKKYLLGILKDGNLRANSIAKIKLREIYDKIGFLNLI